MTASEQPAANILRSIAYKSADSGVVLKDGISLSPKWYLTVPTNPTGRPGRSIRWRLKAVTVVFPLVPVIPETRKVLSGHPW